jgi:hypothetical protein
LAEDLLQQISKKRSKFYGGLCALLQKKLFEKEKTKKAMNLALVKNA